MNTKQKHINNTAHNTEQKPQKKATKKTSTNKEKTTKNHKNDNDIETSNANTHGIKQTHAKNTSNNDET